MGYIFYNPNPVANDTRDCTVRAIAKALDVSWEEAYIMLALNGINMGVMIDDGNVFGSVLRQHSFYKELIPNTCPDCYTADDFCRDHPIGTYVLVFGAHIATVQNGNIYDTWDSSRMIPIYYWYKKENNNEPIISGIDGTATNPTVQ